MILRLRQPPYLILLGLIVTVGLVYPLIVAAQGTVQLTFFSSSVIPAPPPQIARVSPDHGDNDEETVIHIEGAHFVQPPLVRLGDLPLAQADWISSTEIVAVVPAGLPSGTYTLWVCNPDGQCGALPNAFSVVHAGPTVTAIVPSQGYNDAPNAVVVYGSRFDEGVTLAVGSTLLQQVERLSETAARGIVPAGLPAGRYDVVADNPDPSPPGVLPDGYLALDPLDPTSDDFSVREDDLWTLPITIRQGETVQLGVNVHRQGGQRTLQPEVAFYVGDPANGGILIGRSSTPPMPPGPGVVDSTFVAWDTTGLPEMVEVYVVVDPDDRIAEASEANNIAHRTLVLLGANGDMIPPEVVSLFINEGAPATTDPEVTITLTASDRGGSGVASMYLVEREFNSAAREWVAVQHTGWIPFRSAFTMTLTGGGGVRYIQAWVADGAGNISIDNCKARIDYIVPVQQIYAGQVHLYRRDMAAGQKLEVHLRTLRGDADLYIWSPDGAQRWASTRAGTASDDLVIFPAPVGGRYQIEVYGYADSEYQLSFGPGLAGAEDVEPLGVAEKTLRSAPAIAPSNEPPGRSAVPSAPSRPVFQTYLPITLRNSGRRLQAHLYLPLTAR